MSAAKAEPLYFGPPARPLLGFYHPSAEPRSCAVVLCYPFGHEYTAVYQTYRFLAERLADAGFPVLRFDYDGTGDSVGSDADPDRLRAWLDSIRAAIDKVLQLSGQKTVGLVGLRLGATLAYLAAAEHPSVSRLVLWAPSLTGKAYVREWKALRLLKDGPTGSPPTEEAEEEAAGFLMTRQTLHDLHQVELLAGPVPAAQVLLLARDATLGEKRLAAHLRSRGVQVEHRFIPGYATLLVEPYNVVVPDAVFAEIVAFFSAACPPAQLCPPPAAAGSESAQLRLPHAAVRESAVCFGADQALFGILTEPSGPAAESHRPALLLLNTSVIHRVGANRMHVPMARHFAAAGFPVLRLDLAGLGDSPHSGWRPRQRMYSQDGVQDVRAAMDYLAATRGINQFIVVGLCSGAYMAFHTGLADSRVIGQVMLNPQTFEWKEGDSLDVGRKLEYKSFRFYLRKALQQETWSRLLQGRVHWQGILRALTERVLKNARTSLQQIATTLIENRAAENKVWNKFKELLERNIHMYLVYSQEDPGLDEFALQLGKEAARLQYYRNFKLELIDGPDHTFTPLWSQRRVEELITTYLMRWQ